jgi:hypothetical protein
LRAESRAAGGLKMQGLLMKRLAKNGSQRDTVCNWNSARRLKSPTATPAATSRYPIARCLGSELCGEHEGALRET